MLRPLCRAYDMTCPGSKLLTSAAWTQRTSEVLECFRISIWRVSSAFSGETVKISISICYFLGKNFYFYFWGKLTRDFHIDRYIYMCVCCFASGYARNEYTVGVLSSKMLMFTQPGGFTGNWTIRIAGVYPLGCTHLHPIQNFWWDHRCHDDQAVLKRVPGVFLLFQKG